MSNRKPERTRDRGTRERTGPDTRGPTLSPGPGRMTRTQLRAKLTAILRRFLPDFDPKALEPDASLRKALAADSMDVLNFVVAIHDELGIDIPEADYPKIDTLDDCLDYLGAAIAARETRTQLPPVGAPR
jgi:acyl carrier protein